MVFGAPEDVNVAFPLSEMVVISALEAAPAVTVSLDALANLESSARGQQKCQGKHKIECVHACLKIVRNFKEYRFLNYRLD
jgi:hypothetical protein